MAYYDGRALTAYEAALAQPRYCSVCGDTAYTTRDGALLCNDHAWKRAAARVKAMFAGEVLPA